jgi:hypothetical protein
MNGTVHALQPLQPLQSLQSLYRDSKPERAEVEAASGPSSTGPAMIPAAKA